MTATCTTASLLRLVSGHTCGLLLVCPAVPWPRECGNRLNQLKDLAWPDGVFEGGGRLARSHRRIDRRGIASFLLFVLIDRVGPLDRLIVPDGQHQEI